MATPGGTVFASYYSILFKQFFRDVIHAGMLLCFFVFMATLHLYLVNRGAPQRLSLCAFI